LNNPAEHDRFPILHHQLGAEIAGIKNRLVFDRLTRANTGRFRADAEDDFV
jgi:hypothetical protein